MIPTVDDAVQVFADDCVARSLGASLTFSL
jgi:hypothetical protein